MPTKGAVHPRFRPASQGARLDSLPKNSPSTFLLSCGLRSSLLEQPTDSRQLPLYRCSQNHPTTSQDLGALKIPEQSRLAIWRGLQDMKQGAPLQLPTSAHHHDYHGQQLLRSSSNMAAMAAIGAAGGELQRQRVMEAVHFRVRHTITIPNRSGVVGTSGMAAAADEWADFGFDMPDCKVSRNKHSIKEEFMESDVH